MIQNVIVRNGSDFPESSKVALLLRDLPAGGVEKVFINLAKGLLARGYRVDIVVFEKKGRFVDKVDKDIPVISLDGKQSYKSLRIWSLLKLTKNLANYIRNNDVCWLISAKEQANFVAVATKLTLCPAIKILITRHVPLVGNNAGRDASAFTRLLYRFFLHHADALVAVSQGVKDQICSLVPAEKTHKVHCIANPVISSQMFKKAGQPIENSDSVAFKEGFLIVSAGRLSWQKGFDILLKAVSIVRKKFLINLIILGDGNEKAALLQCAEKLGISDMVEFAGDVDNPYPYFKRADVYVLSSRYEGLPTVLIEAVTLNNNIVATDCLTGPREILRKSGCGTLVPVDDWETMAEAIQKYLICKDLTEPKLINEYTVDGSIAAYEQLMSEVRIGMGR